MKTERRGRTHTETDSVSSEDAAEMTTTEYVLYVDAPKCQTK